MQKHLCLYCMFLRFFTSILQHNSLIIDYPIFIKPHVYFSFGHGHVHLNWKFTKSIICSNRLFMYVASPRNYNYYLCQTVSCTRLILESRYFDYYACAFQSS